MRKVFITYNRVSLDAVKSLAEDLEAALHEPWFDQELTGGQRWWDSILARIRASDVFVFALTPDSLESQACGRELDYALALGKPVLPVLLSLEVQTNYLPAAIGQIQYVDYCKQDKQAALALVRALAGLPTAPPLPDLLPEPPPVPISYVVSLKEKIDCDAPLDYQDQIALVMKLRDRFREGRPIEEITDLLDRLKRRDDLLAKVLQEIESVLAEISQRRSTPPPRRKAAKRDLASAPEAKAPVPEGGSEDRKPQHMKLDDAVEECARLMQRVVDRSESWIFEIDPQNHFTLKLDSSTPNRSIITAKAELRDNMSGARSKELKNLGWKTNDHGFVKGAGGAAALYATSGIAALALLSKSVRDHLMAFDATRSWTVTRAKDALPGPAAEFALALQRVAPGVKKIIVRRPEAEKNQTPRATPVA